MIDSKELRKDPFKLLQRLQTKEPELSIEEVMRLDDLARELQARLDAEKAVQHRASEEIPQRKKKGIPVDDLLEEMTRLKESVQALSKELRNAEEQREALLALLPNIPASDVPISPDPKDNVVIKEVGAKPHFHFTPKNHMELGEALGLFDFTRGAKASGSGFVYYTARGAKLEWALLNYMLDLHTKSGYEMLMPPLLMRPEMMRGSAHLPKFEAQLFKTDELYLIPTAEAAINAFHFDEILPEEVLPKRYVAYTPCFRREAGAAGRGERGLIRMHQFNKVELFAFTKPEESEAMHQTMTLQAEKVLQGLGIPYRLSLLVTGDTSFAAAKTIDMEVWLPGQNRFYEVSSISNCTDFQARRSKIRFKRGADKPEFVHTLNGSGVATSRLMIALLEQNQQADGSVRLPKALEPYIGTLLYEPL